MDYTRVFETGSGKWVSEVSDLNNGSVIYTSDIGEAKEFNWETIRLLIATNEYRAFHKTMQAVPIPLDNRASTTVQKWSDSACSCHPDEYSICACKNCPNSSDWDQEDNFYPFD